MLIWYFPNNLDIFDYVGKLPEQHFSVWLFSNPGNKIFILLKFIEARILEWNICQLIISILDNVFYNRFHLTSSLVSNFSEIWWPLFTSAYSLENHKKRQHNSCAFFDHCFIVEWVGMKNIIFLMKTNTYNHQEVMNTIKRICLYNIEGGMKTVLYNKEERDLE